MSKSPPSLERSFYSPPFPARIQASFLSSASNAGSCGPAHEMRTWETTPKHSLHQWFFWSTTSLNCTRKCLSTKGDFVYLSHVLNFLPWSQHLDNTEMPSVVIQSWISHERKKICCINPQPLETWGFFIFSNVILNSFSLFIHKIVLFKWLCLWQRKL